MTILEKVKQSLIEKIEERKKNKIIDLSNAELLIELINSADSVKKAIAIAELGTTYKRTGFYFNKKLEKIGPDIKYFRHNVKLSFETNKDELTHQLIIGDNYDALLNLLITHKNKMDIIYIDPPYGKDSMGKCADTNYTNTLTRDSLLSMLYPRLELSKQLLTDDGIIFCSIDDKNQAYVKCLFDEVFGEENFITNIVWKSGGGKSDSKYIKNKKEYLLVYSKTQNVSFSKKSSPIKNYKLIDENGKRYCERGFDMQGLKYSKSLDYPIQTPDGTYIYAGKSFENWQKRQNGIVKDRDFCWTLSKKEFEKRKAENRIVFKKVKNEWRVYYKSYYENKETAYEDILTDIDYFDKVGNYSGTQEIKLIFNSRIFDYPKPSTYIKWIINLVNKKNAIILDFFAGSGTTGQAVLELNKEDGGNRQFILCTNNEITKNNPNGIAYDVTSERLKRVMTGTAYDGTSDFDWIKNNKPYGNNLKVVEIESVNNIEQTPVDVIDETCYGLKKFKTPEEKKTVDLRKF